MRRYDAAVQRPYTLLSAAALIAMLLFGLLFSLLPPSVSRARSGVTLSGVRLTLYPAQDPQAQWRFSAQQITVDPEREQHTLRGLSRGERWITASGQPPKLDMTLNAQTLTIDGQDNLSTQEATLYTLADCSRFTLRGSPDTPVIITQAGGYSAPRGSIESPLQRGNFRNIRANFDFSAFEAEQDPGMEFHAAARQRCVAGALQPNKGAS